MSSNRLADYLAERRPARFSFEIAAPRQTAVPQQAFAACPAALIPIGNAAQLAWQMSIYRRAYEQALVSVETLRRARHSASRWN